MGRFHINSGGAIPTPQPSIVEVVKHVEIPVEKVVYVTKEVPVEKIVYIDKIVEVEKIVQVEVIKEVGKLVHVEPKVVYQRVEVPVEVIKEVQVASEPKLVEIEKITHKVPNALLVLISLETIALIVCLFKLL